MIVTCASLHCARASEDGSGGDRERRRRLDGQRPIDVVRRRDERKTLSEVRDAFSSTMMCAKDYAVHRRFDAALDACYTEAEKHGDRHAGDVGETVPAQQRRGERVAVAERLDCHIDGASDVVSATTSERWKTCLSASTTGWIDGSSMRNDTPQDMREHPIIRNLNKASRSRNHDEKAAGWERPPISRSCVPLREAM